MKLKKFLPCLVFLTLSIFLTACSSSVSDPKVDNWAKFEQQKTITIGFDNTFVPMGFELKNGQYAGFDIDLANAVFAEYGIKV